MGVTGKKVVKPGYKLTDVGVIPEEWEVVPIWDLLAFKNGLNKEKEAFWHWTPIVNYMDVYRNRWLKKCDVGWRVELSSGERKNFQAKKGDVFFTRTSETVDEIGLSSVLLEDISDVTFSGFLLRWRPKNDRLDMHYKMWCFSTKSVRQEIVSASSYTTRALTNGGSLSKVRLILPDNQEQSTIAQVLSDTDALIASLDALIEKKRAIKQGAMQELLTGKRRLPGFKNALRRFKIGEIGFCFWGLVGKSKADFGKWNAKYIPFLNVMKNPVIDLTFLENVSIGSGEKQNVVRKDDLIFNWSSETPEEVGLCSVVRWEIWELYLNSFCFGFRAWNPGMIEWLYISYFFRSEQGRRMMSVLAQGATRYNLSKSAFLDSEICLPNFDEQSAISSVLSDMDAEISALEAKRDKYKAIKQGMMQELLTGNIRLVWAK